MRSNRIKVRLGESASTQRLYVIDTYATPGAVLGTNLYLEDGETLITRDMLFGTPDDPGGNPEPVYWRFLQEVPPNVVALAETVTTGLYAITGPGTSVTREIQPTIGRTTVANGDGVAGNPVVDLAVVPDSGVGAAILRITRDMWGRISGTQAATTTDLAEGTNLYFTAARVLATALSGLSAASATVITAADTVLSAFGKIQAQITALAASLSGYVPTSRTISTTAPLTGGGNLSANRTLSITAASGAAAGSMSSANFTKLAGIAAGATAGATWGMNLASIPANITSWAAISPAAKQDSLTNSTTNTIVGTQVQRAALTGDVTAAADANATTIASDAVTNAKLANVATATIKGRTTAGTGDPEDLTAAQALAVIGAEPAVAAGTAGQFWRGDKTFTNTLLSSLTIESAVAAMNFRRTGATYAGIPIGQWDVFAEYSGTFYVCATITPRSVGVWSASDRGTRIQVRTIRTGTTALVEHSRFGESGEFSPGTDNAQPLGGASSRWSVVYAGTGTINTSDAREKTEVAPMSTAELRAASSLAKLIGTYQWLDAVKEKGEGARRHAGLTVQSAIAALKAEGLDPFRYGFICHDKWESQDEVLDEDGNVSQEKRKAGDRYSFRMDELMMFIARGFEARLSALESRN